MSNKYIVFDLDDTLIYELDYLKSAYKEIATILDKDNSEKLYALMLNLYENKDDVFEFLIKKYPSFKKEQLLSFYRNHYPTLRLNAGALALLDHCKLKGYKIGLISDGRSVTQRNKLKALGIEEIFNKIIISEEFGYSKPSFQNFEVFMEPGMDKYYYIADNIKKDFVTPNALGWKTFCLKDQGQNIHPQNIEVEKTYQPDIWVNSLKEVFID